MWQMRGLGLEELNGSANIDNIQRSRAPAPLLGLRRTRREHRADLA
jgi:hypothetical protein